MQLLNPTLLQILLSVSFLRDSLVSYEQQITSLCDAFVCMGGYTSPTPTPNLTLTLNPNPNPDPNPNTLVVSSKIVW